MHYDPLSDEYWDHVEEFDVCTVCEKHLITPDHFLPVEYKLGMVSTHGVLRMRSIGIF